MAMIVMWIEKTWLITVVAALSFGALPGATAHTLGSSDPTTPTPSTQTPADRLANIWSRERDAYAKIGSFLVNSNRFIMKVQGVINMAKANGRDVMALQDALDKFADAVKQAEPIYQTAGEVISAHQGFDENGKVVNQKQALATVKDLRNTFIEIRWLLISPRQALRDAIKGFRDSNESSVTPTAPQSGG